MYKVKYIAALKRGIIFKNKAFSTIYFTIEQPKNKGQL